LGIIEEDASFTGYRDCTRHYMDMKQEILRLDLADPAFEIRTPLVHLTKVETLQLSKRLGILDFLLKETISCYRGIAKTGCGDCPSCHIRNNALNLLNREISCSS
jgi:7-cyano-7-deazaguanine synthase